MQHRDPFVETLLENHFFFKAGSDDCLITGNTNCIRLHINQMSQCVNKLTTCCTISVQPLGCPPLLCGSLKLLACTFESTDFIIQTQIITTYSFKIKKEI